jgi:hypothetical protein
MQTESRALNGLDCVPVCRPGRFGNPYHLERFGRDLSMRLFRNTLKEVWRAASVKQLPRELAEEARRHHTHFLQRLGDRPVLVARRELRGRNLACYCPLTVPCHADLWLKLANG